MTGTCSLLSTGAFSSSFLSQSRHSSITIKSQGAQISNHQPKAIKDLFVKPINNSFLHEKRSLVIQLGVLLASVNQPALAVTGNNNYEVDLTGTLISAGIVAFLYFLIMPVAALGTISQLQEIPSRSLHEVSLVDPSGFFCKRPKVHVRN
ncbi:hypothetical protein MRB53_017027 [Persea americana]|uniref:Uncharacterized protein n=1 Tax=Persea americana TaxID=3435 RepID=A0ACC2M4D6_PERAE|nr:hypothetical protein MRB53_017027 [Persea americana]